jgi:hypothetical protein
MRPLLLLITVLALTACHVPAEHTGKRPMGSRRAPEYEKAKTLEDRMAGRESTADSPDRTTGVSVDDTEQVVGAHATHVYHVDTCDELEGVARADRILFISCYDALDGAYKPCPRCRPGP